jgi:hypothetical protein
MWCRTWATLAQTQAGCWCVGVRRVCRARARVYVCLACLCQCTCTTGHAWRWRQARARTDTAATHAALRALLRCKQAINQHINTPPHQHTTTQTCPLANTPPHQHTPTRQHTTTPPHAASDARLWLPGARHGVHVRALVQRAGLLLADRRCCAARGWCCPDHAHVSHPLRARWTACTHAHVCVCMCVCAALQVHGRGGQQAHSIQAHTPGDHGLCWWPWWWSLRAGRAYMPAAGRACDSTSPTINTHKNTHTHMTTHMTPHMNTHMNT